MFKNEIKDLNALEYTVEESIIKDELTNMIDKEEYFLKIEDMDSKVINLFSSIVKVKADL